MDLEEQPAVAAAEALEREVVALPDVRAARVVSTTAGRITEIHLIAEGDKTPKQLVRDVQTLAHAKFNIEIDHRIVSVVKFADEPIQPMRPRAELAAISWSVEGQRASCRVRLEAAGESSIGETSGPATAKGRLRLAADATTQALSGLHGAHTIADVVDIRLIDVNGHRLAVAVVVLLGDRQEQIVTGSAVARGDDGEALCTAILDAYNHHQEA